ncbi:MAG TPA: ubiquitin-like domain-containing protein, partial [Actinopolymorphaceae bacterium]
MRKTFIVGAISAGLLGVVGIAGAAYATLDKSVTLTVDGKSREVHSFGSTVGDILAAENLKVGERDVVSPGRAAAIQDGTEIAVRYARPVRLTIDGRTSERWVTARTVGEALHQLNVRHPDVKVSVSRSKRIGRAGLAFDVRTPKDFTVVHDGRRTRMTAPVLTVGEALSAAEVGVDADDRLRPGLSTFVESGATIEIQRIDERRENVRRKLDYETVRRASSDLYEGTSKV